MVVVVPGHRVQIVVFPQPRALSSLNLLRKQVKISEKVVQVKGFNIIFTSQADYWHIEYCIDIFILQFSLLLNF